MDETTSWVPTRKWIAATVLAVGTVATDWAITGEWTQTLTVAAVGLAVQRAVAWLVPNTTEDLTRMAKNKARRANG